MFMRCKRFHVCPNFCYNTYCTVTAYTRYGFQQFKNLFVVFCLLHYLCIYLGNHILDIGNVLQHGFHHKPVMLVKVTCQCFDDILPRSLDPSMNMM